MSTLMKAWRNAILLDQVIINFHFFYRTRVFVTLLTTAPHSSLFLGTCIHVPFRLFLTGSPTKTLLAFLFLSIRATCQTHLTLIDMIPE